MKWNELQTKDDRLVVELLKGAQENSLHNINQYRQLIFLLLDRLDWLDETKSSIGFYETKIVVPGIYNQNIKNEEEEK